ncbi:nucleoside phosphorylase domain-containing protein [Aspergillus spectabilis]
MISKQLHHGAYAVGWITYLYCELLAARALLDEEHEGLPCPQDPNTYILGRMGSHNVAIVFPGEGISGIAPTTEMVTHMVRTFPHIRFGLLVGTGGGAPGPPDLENPYNDIRLGDVVVGTPGEGHGGIVHYDYGKSEEDGFHISSHTNKPLAFLLKKVSKLHSDHDLGKGKMDEYILKMRELAISNPRLGTYSFPGRAYDKLFPPGTIHVDGGDCSNCDSRAQQVRLERDEPIVHYGLIASGSRVMKSARRRDELRDLYGILCFETEAAGVTDSFPCLVIRGISSYSDSHKNDRWEPYAAVTAAAYAKDLLRIIVSESDTNTQGSIGSIQELSALLASKGWNIPSMKADSEREPAEASKAITSGDMQDDKQSVFLPYEFRS